VSLSLVGIHTDGGLQERLRLPAHQLFPVGDQHAAVTALVEPVSIGVRTVARGRVTEGEKVVVLGAGPIGQAVALAAIDRGASVLLLDRFDARLELGRLVGAETLPVGESEPFPSAREWAGGDGPEVVVEATGVPELVRDAVELVAQAGRVVVVGLSAHDAPLRVGALPFKELDLLGVSCCGPSEFAEAVALVARNREAVSALVTHEFPLARAPEAIAYAMQHPAEVMKAIIRLEEA
jgi:L-gulonate 5-dehydrogenase